MRQPTTNDHEFITVPELARRTGIGAKRLRRAIRDGDLVAYTFGTAWPRVSWAEFEKWMRGTRVRVTSHARRRVAELEAREAAKEAAHMIYLASPYSHPDLAVREQRFHAACCAAAKLIRVGHVVISPVVHSHLIATQGLPTDWRFWERCDRTLLERCDHLVVLMLDGWHESEGVRAETALSKKRGIPIGYLLPEPRATTPTLALVAEETEG